MTLPSNRSLRRLAAVGLAAAAIAAVAVAPRTSALPQCGYLIYWYSSPAKTTIVGSRVADPQECGCATFEIGQRTAYSTLTSLAGCDGPPPMPDC